MVLEWDLLYWERCSLVSVGHPRFFAVHTLQMYPYPVEADESLRNSWICLSVLQL